MRRIPAKRIEEEVSRLCARANFSLRPDVLVRLKRAKSRERRAGAREVLEAIIKNAQVAARQHLAICQDTGLPSVFVELGAGVSIKGDLRSAINKGIASGYRRAFLRDSIVKDPLKRGRPTCVPAIIHVEVVSGDRLKLTVLPKGFGCENKTQLKMFLPTAGTGAIKDFIVKAVNDAGPDACPPYVVGVGIGGSADYALLLAKKALLEKITRKSGALEKELERRINGLGIGPMGLGGRTTVLAVKVKTFPTHIAGLPVAVNISCHALRSATGVL